MASKKFRVSQSKVKSYLRCRRQYYNKYVLGLRRKRVKRPLMFGRMVHEMLEAHANGSDPFKVLKDIGLENMRLFASEREEYGEIVEDCGLIMRDYFDHYKNSGIKFMLVDGRRAEYPFEIDLDGDILWNGKLDGFAKLAKSKFTHLVEHKTFKKAMPNEDDRWRNLQSTTYVEAARMMGWPVPEAVLWDYVKSAPPARPAILQSGATSANKNLNSLPSVVASVLKERGEDPKKFKGLMDAVAANRSKWFTRETRPIRPGLVENVMADFTSIAREVKDTHGKVKHRTIDRHCSWCDFEPLCRAEMEGGDVDFITQREYYIEEDTDHKESAVVTREKSKRPAKDKKLGNLRSRGNRKDHAEQQLPETDTSPRHKGRRNGQRSRRG